MTNHYKILLFNFILLISYQSYSQYNCVYKVGEETRYFDNSSLRVSPIKLVYNENNFLGEIRGCHILTNNVYPAISINDAFQKRDSVNALFISEYGCKKLDSTELMKLEKLTNINILFTHMGGYGDCNSNHEIFEYNLHKLVYHFHCLDKVKYCQLGLIDSFFTNNIDTMYILTYLRCGFTDENIDLGKFPNLDTLYCYGTFRNSISKLDPPLNLTSHGRFKLTTPCRWS